MQVQSITLSRPLLHCAHLSFIIYSLHLLLMQGVGVGGVGGEDGQWPGQVLVTTGPNV